jgi:hypothetical protein
MADEFGQRIEGLHSAGDAVVATDKHIAVLAKNESDEYEYLSVDANGKLSVTGGTEYAVADTAGATDSGGVVLVVRNDTPATLTEADGEYTRLNVDEKGYLWVAGTDLDVRTLDSETPGDNVAIKSTTGNELKINADGSLDVNAQLGALNSVYQHGSVNLIKDTLTTVVTRAPSVDEFYSAIMVSGAGYCEWQLEFGTTASEAIIMKFWTTPAHPTHYVDLPDYLTVDNTQTVRIRATNREKAGSPSSDFTGYASLVRKA